MASHHIGAIYSDALCIEFALDPQSMGADECRRGAALLHTMEWDLGDLAELVWVGRDTIRRRLGRAAGWVAVQPSCFDGVEVIPEDFTPWRRRWLAGFRYETPEGQGMFWPVAA